MEMEDPKKAGKFKEKANKESTKLKRNFQKIQRKADELIIKEELETVQNMKKMQIDGNFLLIIHHFIFVIFLASNANIFLY